MQSFFKRLYNRDFTPVEPVCEADQSSFKSGPSPRIKKWSGGSHGRVAECTSGGGHERGNIPS